MIPGTILWLTGLSGSGKTTLATALQARLRSLNKTSEVLDGDAVRNARRTPLRFTRNDIKKQNKTLVKLALRKAAANDYVIVSAISPFRADRANAKNLLGERFVEIFVDCPLATCIERDVKGLYKKALAGGIANFIGIDPAIPYEAPQRPHMRLTTDVTPLDDCVALVIEYLDSKKKPSHSAYTS